MSVIVARASGAGRSAVAWVRLSGEGLSVVRDAVLRPRGDTPWRSRVQRRVDLVHRGEVFDDGLATWVRGPNTATGEDCLEVGLHGNPLLVDRCIAACLDAGARLARPGEFTRRGVEHGKLDLLQAEGIDQLIRARTADGLVVARQGVAGPLSAWTAALRASLLAAAAELEARLDYPDDELALCDDDALRAQLRDDARRCTELARTHAAGRVRVQGARVALVGPVNAGKSSLFNALLGRPRALVHDTPGTTRDVVEATVVLHGQEITLLDTAGERVTDDPVEAAGLALAQQLVAEADLLVIVLRDGPDDPVEADILARTSAMPRLVVVNQIDRPERPAVAHALGTSATTGQGVDALGQAIADALTGSVRDDALQIASERQADRMQAVARLAEEAADCLATAGPAVAADAVVEALGVIDELTGADTREDVLSELFSRFCIGK
mgnify:CR=1 FL=1